MKSIATLDAELNDMIREGNVLEAFEKYYSDDVVMMENDELFTGKETNRKREQEFFGSVEKVHSAEIGPAAVSDNVTFCEQSFDLTFKDGKRVKMEEVAVRHWKNGKVVLERFYYKGM